MLTKKTKKFLDGILLQSVLSVENQIKIIPETIDDRVIEFKDHYSSLQGLFEIESWAL